MDVKSPLELSIRLGREERGYMARWLALEVLMTDEVVIADPELYDRLSALQDSMEEAKRALYSGLA